MKYIIILALLLCDTAYAQSTVDLVLVKKSEKKLYLIQKQKIIKEYKVSFGANPKGHKEKEGDERTPEGRYILDYKKADSAFYKAIHISYPNADDTAKAKKKNANPGGQVMIHGQKNGLSWLSFIVQKFNWTNGCIAVTNKEMEEIWNMVDVNTQILIEK